MYFHFTVSCFSVSWKVDFHLFLPLFYAPTKHCSKLAFDIDVTVIIFLRITNLRNFTQQVLNDAAKLFIYLIETETTV